MISGGFNSSPVCRHLDVPLASGATTSDEIDLAGTTLAGVYFPAVMTGTTLTIQVSAVRGGTYRTVQKDESGGGDYTITVTASKYVPITNLAVAAGLRWIKLVSGSAEAAARTITLATRPV